MGRAEHMRTLSLARAGGQIKGGFGRGQIFAHQLMVMDPMGREINLPGVHTTEPTFGLPATWIEPALRDEAELRGYSIIDPSTVISTHLTEVLKANVADLLSYANVQSLLAGLSKDQQKLLEDMVPAQISVSGILRVLQTLLGLRAPRYHHHDLIRHDTGRKLAKSKGDESLADLRAAGATAQEIRTLLGFA